jgi:nucleoside-diphosphate-sugar epimerase
MSINMTKIRVTGGAGFIGSHVVRLNLEEELGKTVADFREMEKVN